MKRLHVKLFVAIWLVAGTVSLIAISYDNTRTNRSVAVVTPATMPNSVSQRLADDLLSSIVAHDFVSLSNAFKGGEERINQFVYILDERNEDLLHRALPGSISSLANQVDENTRIAQQDNNIARFVTLSDGTHVKAITYIESTFDVYFRVYAKHFFTWVLFGLVTSSLACYWLATWICNDLKGLKQASREIAEGNLSTRVLPHNRFEFLEFSELARDFDLMTERLEHSLLQQKRITKEISHELRAPISRIAVAVELAKRQNQGKLDKELKVIARATDSLQETITNILSMPEDDEEEDDFSLPDIVDLVPLLKSLLIQNQKQAKQKNVQFMTLFKCDEILISTRSSMLVGVFDNILRNALKYTKENSSIYLKVSTVNNGSAVQVVIGDEGPGVAQTELNKIFQPFFRSDRLTHENDGGCGLGLAIAHRTVALHQGNITAENRVNGGLAIFVTLPVITDDEFDLEPTSAVTA